jgi:hypothetical protein
LRLGAEKQGVTQLAERLDTLDLELNDELRIRDEHIASPNYAGIEGGDFG